MVSGLVVINPHELKLFGEGRGNIFTQNLSNTQKYDFSSSFFVLLCNFCGFIHVQISEVSVMKTDTSFFI
jgi:hypothetical protein